MEVVRDLTCPICLEFYTHPIILPCSHVLCRRPCAENIFEVNFIRCPVCRDNCYVNGGITSLPRVITLESIIEKIRAERKKRAVANKSKKDTSSASESTTLTNDDTTCEDMLAEMSSNGCGPEFSPITSPTICSSKCNDESSARTTPNRLSPILCAPNLRSQRHLPLFNLPTSVPYNSSRRGSSSSLSSRVSSHALDNSPTTPHRSALSSIDYEIQNILAPTTNRWITSSPPPPAQNTPSESAMRSELQSPLVQPIRADLNHATTNQNNRQTLQIHWEDSSASEIPNSAAQNPITESQPLAAQDASAVRNRSDLLQLVSSSTPMNSQAIANLSFASNGSEGVTYRENEVIVLKHDIQDQLRRLCDVQCQLLVCLTSYKDKADGLQDVLDKRRTEINNQCDSLVAEVESKRSHFLENVDDESKWIQAEVDDATLATERLLTSTQQLACFAEQLLEARPDVLVQTAPVLLDGLNSSVKECELCLLTSEPRLRSVSRRHVDLRNEQLFLRQIEYLQVPSQPVIDVERCTRNNATIALVLAPPLARDVVDSYEICYCSREQKRLDIEETHVAKLSSDYRANIIDGTTFPFIIIENLCRTTNYYFSACAVNREGRGQVSDHVQCMTLGDQECVVPVPIIINNLCFTSTTSVDICCPSPNNVTVHQGVSHYILYRQEGGAYIWQGHEMEAKEEHRVSRLRPDTEYQFLVLACNTRGECQISDKISLRTSIAVW